ncbi:MAG: hypothetical protein SVV03_06335 [Candidatus Nanohaloarchaea archaeon]|nr:hypothetical protein [Candidatus Nanohaloarchaea archaeon]
MSSKSRKAQMSLEMIIGLVILLVVASVVISLFLNVFQEPDVGRKTVERQQMGKVCGNLCQNWKDAEGKAALSAAVNYCTRTFTFDENGDGNTRQVAGSGFNSYCENGIRCFNVNTCKTGFTTLNYEKCRQLMCSYYTSVNGDPYSLEKEKNVHDHIARLFSPENEETGVGTCNLADLKDSAGYRIATWYNQRGKAFDFYQQDGGSSGVGLPSPEDGGSGRKAQIVCEERFKVGGIGGQDGQDSGGGVTVE